MSAPTTESAAPRPRGVPGTPAILAALAASLAAVFLLNGWAGAATLAFGIVLITRPLDPFVATMLATAVAAFAAYGDRSIQRDLAIVLALSAYAAVSFLVTWHQRRWSFPVSHLATAILGLATTTAIAVVHGVAVHNPFPYLAIELFPLASLGFALVIGGLRLTRNDLTIATWAIAAVGVLSSLAGLVFYGTTGIRTGGMAFSPVPGFVALVVLSLMLYDPAPRPRLVPILVFCILIGHQVVTFTRGFWFGLIVGIPLICVLYARRGEGARLRWGKVVRTLGLSFALMLAVALVAATRPPWNEIVLLLGSRFTSSFETKNTPETVSNLARLVEIHKTMQAVSRSPIFGYGEGATIVVRQFFHTQEAGPQWWIHQGYVMMWFKQGLVGLLALLWVLFAAFRTGWRGAFRAEPHAAGWCVAAAACTLFATVVGLTNYFFFVVSQSFMLAFVWGVALSSARPGFTSIVWRQRATGDGPQS